MSEATRGVWGVVPPRATRMSEATRGALGAVPPQATGMIGARPRPQALLTGDSAHG
jgi:hypothetical protein